MAIHFVNFRDNDEYLSAIKVFDKPDFIHFVHDKRMYQEIDTENDTVVFSKYAKLEPNPIYSYDDSRYL